MKYKKGKRRIFSSLKITIFEVEYTYIDKLKKINIFIFILKSLI